MTQSALDFSSKRSHLKTIFTFIFAFALSLFPYRCVTLVMWAIMKLPSSALTPLTFACSLQLTGEASHMDWKRDWEVLSQSCGDQGEGKWRTQSAVSLSPHLVLSPRIISYLWHGGLCCACLRQPPRSRTPSWGLRKPDGLLHAHLRPHLFLFGLWFSAGAESV